MKLAVVVDDGLASLDFTGVYDPFTRLKTMGLTPDLHRDICANS
jgi:cyclohexyl-isocyanide hydratase